VTNPIVQLLVSIQKAPAPSNLQRKGAFISQGATNTTQGTISFLSQLSDLTAILNGSHAISGISWSGSVATVTTTAPHGLTGSFFVTIAGAVPAGYNGSFLATVTGASAFTYPLATSPGSETTPGVYSLESIGELNAMATTFFANGVGPGVYVLELGVGTPAQGVSFLTTWLTQNPNTFYRFLVPRTWDAVASLLTFLGNYNATNAKVYFDITTNLTNYTAYLATMKCGRAIIEAPNYGTWAANVLTALSQTGGVATATTTTNHGILPGQWFQISGTTPAAWNGWWQAIEGTATNSIVFNVPSTIGAESVLGTLVQSQYDSAGIPSTEFSMAAEFFAMLNTNPSGTNQVAPLNQRYLFGVTPFPLQGNNSLLAAIATANVDVVGTGAQGGISNTLVSGGNDLDGNAWNYWYSIDWVQINTALNLTNYLINGANNPQAPVYYNQAGINGGQTVLAATMKQGTTAGMVLNPLKLTTLSAANYQNALDQDTYSGYTVVNADPFSSYVSENPNDYGNQVYNGYAIEYVPQLGFDSVTINILVSQFAA